MVGKHDIYLGGVMEIRSYAHLSVRERIILDMLTCSFIAASSAKKQALKTLWPFIEKAYQFLSHNVTCPCSFPHSQGGDPGLQHGRPALYVLFMLMFSLV